MNNNRKKFDSIPAPCNTSDVGRIINSANISNDASGIEFDDNSFKSSSVKYTMKNYIVLNSLKAHNKFPKGSGGINTFVNEAINEKLLKEYSSECKKVWVVKNG